MLHHPYQSSSDVYWSKQLSKLVSIPFIALLVLMVAAQLVQFQSAPSQLDPVEFYVPSDLR